MQWTCVLENYFYFFEKKEKTGNKCGNLFYITSLHCCKNGRIWTRKSRSSWVFETYVFTEGTPCYGTVLFFLLKILRLQTKRDCLRCATFTPLNPCKRNWGLRWDLNPHKRHQKRSNSSLRHSKYFFQIKEARIGKWSVEFALTTVCDCGQTSYPFWQEFHLSYPDTEQVLPPKWINMKYHFPTALFWYRKVKTVVCSVLAYLKIIFVFLKKRGNKRIKVYEMADALTIWATHKTKFCVMGLEPTSLCEVTLPYGTL